MSSIANSAANTRPATNSLSPIDHAAGAFRNNRLPRRAEGNPVMEELSRTLTTGENWYLSPSTSTMLAMAVRVRLSIRRQAGSPMSSDSVCAHLNICIRVMRTRVTGVQRRGAVMRRGAPMKSTSCCTVMSSFRYSDASTMADPKRLELKKSLD